MTKECGTKQKNAARQFLQARYNQSRGTSLKDNTQIKLRSDSANVTGAQFSAVEWTRARVAVHNVVAPAPQPEPESRLTSSTRDVSFLRSDSRCGRYVSDLSNVTPTYLGSEQNGRVLSLKLTFSSRLASLLLRWKTADTIFVVLSFIFQVWSHLRLPCPWSAPLPPSANLHQHA